MSSETLRLRGIKVSTFSTHALDIVALGCKWLAATLGESIIHVVLYSILLLGNILQSDKVHP